jgi:hypothetical protein
LTGKQRALRLIANFKSYRVDRATSPWRLIKDVLIQELISEFSLRVKFLAQSNELRRFLFTRFSSLGAVVNSFPQCGHASNGASSLWMIGDSLLTAGQSGFQGVETRPPLHVQRAFVGS